MAAQFAAPQPSTQPRQFPRSGSSPRHLSPTGPPPSPLAPPHLPLLWLAAHIQPGGFPPPTPCASGLSSPSMAHTAPALPIDPHRHGRHWLCAAPHGFLQPWLFTMALRPSPSPLCSAGYGTPFPFTVLQQGLPLSLSTIAPPQRLPARLHDFVHHSIELFTTAAFCGTHAMTQCDPPFQFPCCYRCNTATSVAIFMVEHFK